MSDQRSSTPHDRPPIGAREEPDALQPHALEDEEPDGREHADEPGRDGGHEPPRQRRPPS